MHTSVPADLHLWHSRLGHPSPRITSLVPGISKSSMTRDALFQNCDICLRVKQTRQIFPESLSNAKESFDLIHCDLWGPYRTTAFCGSRYFLTIVDDFSRAVWLYLLPGKTRVAQQLRDFLEMIERQFSKKIKTIRSDNGSEFLCLTRYFTENRILHETSCVHTPQQNGRVERKHMHILNIARALRFQAHMPIEYWGECVLAAGHIINRTPSALLGNKTPFEKLYGSAPSYKHLRVFGCLAYAHNLDHKGDKFTSRSSRCVFLGYPYGKKGWRLYDIDRKLIFNSRDVVFREKNFPFQTMLSDSTSAPAIVNSPVLSGFSEDDGSDLETNPPKVTQTPPDPELANVPTELLGRGHRVKKPSTRLQGFVANAVQLSPVSLSLSRHLHPVHSISQVQYILSQTIYLLIIFSRNIVCLYLLWQHV
ncbi:uncharacterized protein LOC106356373 isoform X1 [Brassica napus]|uniref:uncharacterized protein LOC106356373 isoform X1 n=1 Tax=Brassica napus TaxID=3708 RepID=UPI00207AE17D|nr:uncharacterized protein LOC106356373 isoform X1 [Brassica napus]